MTVDRDQTRRDAETLSRWLGEQHTEFEMKVKELVDALLSELEQAERDRDGFARNCLAVEARLVKVPALVEAAKQLAEASDEDAWRADEEWRDALADWEQE